MTEIDLDRLRSLRGLYVGMLDEGELAMFSAAVSKGLAYRDCSGVASFFLGVAKVGVYETTIYATE